MTALRQAAVLCWCLIGVMSVSLSVRASLWLEFEPSEASPEAEVFASTIGQDAATGALANLSPDNVVVLYLAADEAEVETAQDPAAVRLGELEIDEDGHGQLTFMVPDIAPGSYVAYLHCQGCSFDAAGLTFAEAGLFEVSATDLPATGGNLEVLAIGAAFLLVGGAIVFVSRGRRSKLRPGPPTKKTLSPRNMEPVPVVLRENADVRVHFVYSQEESTSRVTCRGQVVQRRGA